MEAISYLLFGYYSPLGYVPGPRSAVFRSAAGSNALFYALCDSDRITDFCRINEKYIDSESITRYSSSIYYGIGSIAPLAYSKDGVSVVNFENIDEYNKTILEFLENGDLEGFPFSKLQASQIVGSEEGEITGAVACAKLLCSISRDICMHWIEAGVLSDLAREAALSSISDGELDDNDDSKDAYLRSVVFVTDNLLHELEGSNAPKPERSFFTSGRLVRNAFSPDAIKVVFCASADVSWSRERANLEWMRETKVRGVKYINIKLMRDGGIIGISPTGSILDRIIGVRNIDFSFEYIRSEAIEILQGNSECAFLNLSDA